MGDKHVTSMGNIHVTTMGEYTRDHHTRDTSHYIVGKSVFIPSLIHRKVFVVYKLHVQMMLTVQFTF